MKKKAEYYFEAADYVIFVGLLVGLTLTGVYFALRGKIYKHQRPQSFKDFLTGSRKFKPLPVAMSLIASYISAITMLGTPAEIYNFGAQYWIIVFAMIASSAVVATVYLPVFSRLKVASSYEYLEMRFSRHLRTIASVVFLLDEIMFAPMLIYVPSLALNQVSGANLHLIAAISCAVVVLYTVLGGVRAVVYTDTWQTVIMFVSDFVVIILGIVSIGGFGVIIDRSLAGNRIQHLNFSPSMYERYTVFSILIGGFTYWTSFNAVNQTMVQRYLSLENNKHAIIAIALFTLGCMFFISMCCFAGLLIYSTYSECDPLISERIDNSDQLLPLFVVETAGHLKGIPGLFIAGVFGAGLSSLAIILNSSAIVLLEDLCRGVFRISFTEKKGKMVSTVIVVTLGVTSILLVFIVEVLGGIFQVATSLSAIATGTMFGVFTLGMLIPWANSKGAAIGAIVGFIFTCIVSFGAMYASSFKLAEQPKLPISIKSCTKIYGLNVTHHDEENPNANSAFPLFRLSFLWITPVGVVTVLVVGTIASFITGKTDLRTIDPDVISPVVHWTLPPEAQFYAGSAVRKIKFKRLFADNSLINLPIQRDLSSTAVSNEEN